MTEDIRQSALKLFEAEIQLDAKLQGLQQRRAELESGVGGDLLEAHLSGADESSAIYQGRDIDREISAVREAITAARSKRREVIREGFIAEAKTVRGRVEALRAEIRGREAKLGELLAAIKDLEGVEYQPPKSYGAGSVPAAQSIGKTEKLRQQVRELEGQAQKLEQQDAPDSAFLRGNAADLIRQLANRDPETIAPPLESVRVWATEAERLPALKMGGMTSGPRFRGWKRFLLLSWTAGEIDTSQSGPREDPIFDTQEQVA